MVTSSNMTVPAPTVSVSNGITTINFGQNDLTDPFANSFSFMTDTAYTADFRASTSTPNETFTAATLTGPGLTGGSLTFAGVGTPVLELLGVSLLGESTYTVSLAGGGRAGATYTGNGTLGAVPEPATWAMMLLGFGAMGFTLRRRPKAALAQIA